jgi:hypothetical protein
MSEYPEYITTPAWQECKEEERITTQNGGTPKDKTTDSETHSSSTLSKASLVHVLEEVEVGKVGKMRDDEE